MKITGEKINLADIAFLQAYLIEIFEFDSECEKNFKHTEWYLNQKFDEEEKALYLQFIKERGASCDCDVIRKINLQEETDIKRIIKHDD